MQDILKRNVKKFLLRMWARLAWPVEARLSTLESGWQQHLPALLNATSSVAAFGYELTALRTETTNLWKAADQATKTMGDLWQRLEIVRQEIMYEMKYGGCAAGMAAEHSVRIIAADKIERARAAGEIRLNLGCGHVPLDGYINIDQRDLPGVDITADVGNLPFEAGSLREIFSAHVLEHFPQERLRRLLPYWRSRLADAGTFRAIMPDGEAMLAGVADGSYSFEDFREVLFGGQEYEGDFHYNLFTPASMSGLLAETGFTAVEVLDKARRNGKCFEFEIKASRGSPDGTAAR